MTSTIEIRVLTANEENTMMVDNTTISTLTATITKPLNQIAQKKDALFGTGQQKQGRRGMLDQAAQMYETALAMVDQDSNKNVAQETFANIKKTFGDPSWMSRFKIYYHWKKYVLPKRQEAAVANNNPPSEISITVAGRINSDGDNSQGENNDDTVESDISDLSDVLTRKKGGRPQGITVASINEYKSKIEKAKAIAAGKYQEIKKQQTNKKLANGTLQSIIKESIQEIGLPLDNVAMIPQKTISNRVARNNIYGMKGSFSQSSPMLQVEGILAELCRHLNRMAKSINQKEFISLANDIIEDTPTEDRVRKYREKICGVTTANGKANKLGKKYFYNFMSRHKDIIHTTRINKKCLNRLEWATYENIQKMYYLVHKEMVVAGIATQLQKPAYFDKDNNQHDHYISNVTFGTTSNIAITDPSYLIFVDETGSSTNMKKDKTSSKKVIAEKGYSGTKQAITSDLRYTTMGFTAATGEAVMCCLILTWDSKKGIPNSWLTGIDITKIDATFEGTDDEKELIQKVRQAGGVAGGGPRCNFRDVDVPCFIQYSPHGGITPAILTNCLRQMSSLGLFPRTDNKRPLLLLDGHDSRFDLQFLRYTRDMNHPWCVCIGLPYGTHQWQVGDSPAQNGNYKNYEQEFKDTILREKQIRAMRLVLTTNAIVPIVNYAWEKSFAVTKNNKKAILERGWFPSNRSLLTHPDVLRTRKVMIDSNLTCSQTKITDSTTSRSVVLNTNNGTAATLLEAAINDQQNNPEAMQRKKDRLMLGEVTTKTSKTIRKFTSGVAFFNNMVGLHTDQIWDRQALWEEARSLKELEKKCNKENTFFEKTKV